ncbi:MAG: site-specific DNA-methyltransferase [Anaerolineae bacterium]|nr:site-specific DNA-methyltransferase [Anaerolineae bacterium]
MVHLSENSSALTVTRHIVESLEHILKLTREFTDVAVFVLPDRSRLSPDLLPVLREAARWMGSNATLVVLGDPVDLAAAHITLREHARYQTWIAVKRATILSTPDSTRLPMHHWGMLIHTRYVESLRHTKTRIQYTYCPACGKTTKDYGGKKHTYHHLGTLMSDVWRDVAVDLQGDIASIMTRLADFFGLPGYSELRVLDCRNLPVVETIKPKPTPYQSEMGNVGSDDKGFKTNCLINGDCLHELAHLPDDVADFVFVDPPYNLGKTYSGYTDDLEIKQYFEWCDTWLTELARILKPGRTLCVLNIPLWAIRHFLHLDIILSFQNWIAWDALSYPVRQLMPAHYAILCFSNGPSRPLPGLLARGDVNPGMVIDSSPAYFESLSPLAENFCLRSSCVRKRRVAQVDDRGPLTDLWWDIHRLKHNSRRVDHPTQLPPQLLYRLISLFTAPGEVVLDCFNGSGTTTLAAHQLDRRYIGIELEQRYHAIAQRRHDDIVAGLDPFRKNDDVPKAKNSPIRRMKKQSYAVSKKTLQLEVKRVAEQIGRLPTRDDMIAHGRYPIQYYDDYFVSWGEVCAAARTTGMTELPPDRND